MVSLEPTTYLGEMPFSMVSWISVTTEMVLPPSTSSPVKESIGAVVVGSAKVAPAGAAASRASPLPTMPNVACTMASVVTCRFSVLYSQPVSR